MTIVLRGLRPSPPARSKARRIRFKLAAAGLAVITGALLLGAGLARQFPATGAHAGYILGAGSLAIGIIALLASAPGLIRRNP